MTPTWTDDKFGVTLYHADCLDVLPTLGKVDAVVTDPPYGVNLGNHASANEKRPQWLSKAGYDSYDDSPENFESIVVPALIASINLADRALIFSAGTQMWSLPRPASVGGVYLPAGCGRNAWGFNCLAHFVLYGKYPSLELGAKPMAWASTERAEESNHPCPKPLGWMNRAVDLASRPLETILDPFMGSGTTGVAAVNLGRKFIGIEKERKYFDIAVERIRQAIIDKQDGPLFAEHVPAQGLML